MGSFFCRHHILAEFNTSIFTEIFKFPKQLSILKAPISSLKIFIVVLHISRTFLCLKMTFSGPVFFVDFDNLKLEAVRGQIF